MVLKIKRLGTVGGVDLQGLSSEEDGFLQREATYGHLVRQGRESCPQRHQKMLTALPLSCVPGYGGLRTRQSSTNSQVSFSYKVYQVLH